MCEGDIESFIQQFQKIATANKWSNTASLLHICAHLKHSECKCGNHPTLDETLEALRSKYGLTVRQVRTRLTKLRTDTTKLFLADHAIEVKRLVEAAYADLPQAHWQEIILDLLCNSLNHAHLQRHLLAIKPQGLTKPVEAKNEYFQIKPSGSHHPTSRESKGKPRAGASSPVQTIRNKGSSPGTTPSHLYSGKLTRLLLPGQKRSVHAGNVERKETTTETVPWPLVWKTSKYFHSQR